MNIRLKFLLFLGCFLVGSFMIVTWKSFQIFSQKYTLAMGQAELKNLELQAQTLAQRFQNFQLGLQEGKHLETQLKGLGVVLFAQVLQEEGRWKAHWMEGRKGVRSLAQSATQQIPLENLSSARPSWHMISHRDLGSSLAYVIPSLSQGKKSFSIFFLARNFFDRAFQGSSYQDSLALISPMLGEVYSRGQDSKISAKVESVKSQMRQEQSGVLQAGSENVFYFFHPDLQLYFVRNKQMAPFVIDQPMYLITLGLIIALLVAAALWAQDTLLRRQWAELFSATADEEVSLEEKSQEVSLPAPVETLLPTPSENQMEKFLTSLRPHAINSLGYLHKAKQSSASPHLTLLETELREIRRLIDPQGTTTANSVPVSTTRSQPSFNPFLKENLETIASSKEVEAESESSQQLKIRKPKRESHESGKL